MPSVKKTVQKSLTTSPLPDLLKELGLSIARAQAALDKNSVQVAQEMATTEVEIGDSKYNLLTLGFAPTFYAFTEAFIEAKMSFSLTQSEEFEAGISGGVNTGVYSVQVSGSYARKYDVSMEASSSISTRLVSLPVPERLSQILDELAGPSDSQGNPS